MGKMARPYPTGHFRLYKSKRGKTGQVLAVQIEYAVKSVAVRRSTGIFVYDKDWNPNDNQGRGGVRASYGPDYRAVNNRLLKRVADMDTRIAEWCVKHPGQLTVEMVRALMDNLPITRDDHGIDFIEYVKTVLKKDLERNKIGHSVYKNGLSAMHIFGQFLHATHAGTYTCDKIYVSEISPELVDNYILWRREFKKNSDETINHALTPIFKGCEHAMTDGLISTHINSTIQGMRIAKQKSLQTRPSVLVKHLSNSELKDLLAFYKSDSEPRRKEYIEMFLFAMYACGLRFVDVMTLQWSDIDLQKATLNKIQVKTRNRNIIPLTPQAIDILQQWEGRFSRFVFGLLHDDFNLDNAEALYHLRNTKTKGINQSLNIVSERIGLKFDLTFHVARHTFAVHSLNNGMDLTMVSQLLGHSSSEITEKVYAHYLPAKIIDVLKTINLPSLL